MRRKSERTATKKTKDSPEKERKVEKVKRTRTKRRKQSSSSENESADEKSSVPEPVPQQKEKDAEPAAVKEDSPEETPDQVWQVKTPTKAGDTGEIQKLKICLTRPPSTPEREKPPKSPRSKRKHSRATSSSDTPSVDGEEKKKGKHKSKRSSRDSKDEQEKNQESQSDEPSKEEESEAKKTTENEVSQSSESKEPDNTPVSTTDDNKADEDVQSSETKITAEKANTESQDKPSADDTVTSSKLVLLEDQHSEVNTSSEKDSISDDKKNDLEQSQSESPVTKIPESDDAEQPVDVPEGTEGKCADNKSSEYQELEAKTEETAVTEKVSDVKVKSKKDIDTGVRTSKESHNTTNNTDVVEKRYNQQDKDRKALIDSNKDLKEAEEKGFNKLEGSDCIHSTQEEINGPSTPIIINRKRRWGSRPNKVSTQKSITISTEVLKDIIPDVVKPAEFEEVIEEKKHKKIEMNKKIDRPILPKIVIDNTEHIEHLERDEKENIKLREILPLSNRKISIVNDNDNILARPPSPPRHKQSSILYITNLVRPFTLPLLKNLLQRTGKIVENGFWIDRIKSKCFVQYETEDQAVETRHALHGVTWPVSNPKTLQVDFSTREAFDKAKSNEENDTTPVSTIPGTVEDWLREQDMKRERGELEKPWERKTVREWDVGKGEKDKEDKMQRNVKDERLPDKRRHRSVERSPEPARKFKKREEEAPAKLLDDLFRKTKTTPCIYWLPLSAETIAIKEEQRRQHMAEYERRLNEQRRTRDRRH